MQSMQLLFASSIETIGTLMIAYAALRVHHRVLHEHSVDEKVFSVMKSEQKVGVFGVILVMIGFGMQVLTYL